MLLGFISLLLTVGTTYIAKICVPEALGNKWLPCDKVESTSSTTGGGDGGDEGENGKRKLISNAQEMVWRRALAGPGTDNYNYCASKVSIIIIFINYYIIIIIIYLCVYLILQSREGIKYH